MKLFLAAAAVFTVLAVTSVTSLSKPAPQIFAAPRGLDQAVVHLPGSQPTRAQSPRAGKIKIIGNTLLLQDLDRPVSPGQTITVTVDSNETLTVPVKPVR